MRNDPRVRYTRMIMQTAFLELLRQKPVSKITVCEICEKAEINHNTFYKHYHDCYDLLDKLKEDALARFDELLAGIENRGMESTILHWRAAGRIPFSLFPGAYWAGGRAGQHPDPAG